MADSMESVAQRLMDPAVAEFDVTLLDQVVSAAYDPVSPHRAAANKALMQLQESPDLWTKADAILERSQNPSARFFGLQSLDDAIRTRYVAFLTLRHFSLIKLVVIQITASSYRIICFVC
jgi:exportin-1